MPRLKGLPRLRNFRLESAIWRCWWFQPTRRLYALPRRSIVDLAKGRVMRNGELVGIPAKEMELLRYLIAHRGATVSRDELLREVWNYQSQLTRTVDVHIAGLRQKVEENPEQPNYILTVRGRGYLFRG